MLRPTTLPTLFALLVTILLPTACSTGRSGPIPDERPVLQVDPATVLFPLQSLAVGETGASDVVLTNAGTKELTIREITLAYTAPEGAFEATPAIRLDRVALPALPAVVGTPGSGETEAVVVTVLVTRPDDGFDRSALLRIVSDDRDSPTRVVPISAARPVPVLRVVPDVFDLGQLSEGELATRDGTLRNTGAADLVVSALELRSQSPDFVLTLYVDHVAKTFHPSEATTRVALDPPLVLAPDAATLFQVVYTAVQPEPASAELVFFSNDPATGEAGALVEIRANQAGACLRVMPASVDFGGRVAPGQYLLPVEIASCSAATPLTVTRLELAGAIDGCAGAFCLDVPPELGPASPTAEAPLIVAPGASALVNVVYAPTTSAEVGADGQAVRDTAALAIDSDAFAAHAQVPVSGFGVPDDCPVAVISVQEGEEVLPQTRLHLHGESSTSSGGTIVKYKWTVEQPALSTSKLVPSDSYPSPMFEANVLGSYVFHLEVWDDLGRKSCFAASAKVVAATGCAVHVELLWTSPGDPDPNDEGPNAGTDLDLHFAHPNASQPDLDGNGQADPWFDPTWDVFWFYPLQNWGSISANDDNPSLDLDDVDGWGPENVNLCLPEDGKTYAVGVNYWDDHGFGQSFATVRVYVYGSLVFEVNDLGLVDHDMCWIATVDWPSGQVTPSLSPGGGVYCVHDYHPPLFYQP